MSLTESENNRGMSEPEAENTSCSNKSTILVSSPTKSAISPNANNGESNFHNISLCSSVPICRICHCSGEDERLIEPCRCRGSVRYAHQTCLRTWIVGSAVSSCELCSYKFRTKKKRIKDFREIRFPRPSIKGWLHLSLFLAFFSIMLTSLTWVMWSQLSTSKEAKAERESEEINYAYALNGGFIVMAVIGMYIDSFTQCRSYYRRWAVSNEHLVIIPYNVAEDTDNKLTFSSPINSVVQLEPIHVRLSVSHHNIVLLNDIPCGNAVLPKSVNPVHVDHEPADAEISEQGSAVTSPNEVSSRGHEALSLKESPSSPPVVQHCVTVKETYV